MGLDEADLQTLTVSSGGIQKPANWASLSEDGSIALLMIKPSHNQRDRYLTLKLSKSTFGVICAESSGAIASVRS